MTYKKLIKKLAKLYPTIEDSKRVLNFAGIEYGAIQFSAAPETNWNEIISRVEASNNLKRLLQEISEEFKDPTLLDYLEEEIKFIPARNIDIVMKEEFVVDKDKLKELVDKNRLEEVIDKLNVISGSISEDYRDSITLLSARYRNLMEEYNRGLLRQGDYRIERAKIIRSVLYEINEIDTHNEIKQLLENAYYQKEEVIGRDIGKIHLNIVPKAQREKVLGEESNILPIEWLKNALNSSRIVCKVELNNGGTGTGVLLEGGYLLTNHHVICKYFPNEDTLCNYDCLENKECVSNFEARVLFNYSVSAEETFIYDLDPNHTYILNKDLDYALIKIKDDVSKPLSDWGEAVFEKYKIPKKDDIVNIIQHPEGKAKKIAMPDRVLSIWKEKNYLFYEVDTDEGSSGSPVFNQDWKIIALHHAGIKENEGGMQINATGDTKGANRGILIGAILEDLEKKGKTF